MNRPMNRLLIFCLSAILSGDAWSAGLPDTLKKIKPGVVGVGTYMALRRQQDRLLGTGFVVAGGRYAITNSHVVPRQLDEGRRETVAVYLSPRKNRAQRRTATLVKRDIVHDLCLLRFEGPALPSLRLGRTADVREGEMHAFTGFPILNELWLYPVTHRGIVSSITPIAFPPDFSLKPDKETLRKTMKPFSAFRLDATAYPGNSGSPVYEVATGRVIGVVNSVQTFSGRGSVIADPTGTTFAIPVRHVRNILKVAGVRH